MAQQERSTDPSADAGRRRFVLGTAGALALGSSTALTACGGGSDEHQERFGYGVASGDPLSDRVILWTRVNLGDNAPPTSVQWELAGDPGFAALVGSGTVVTGSEQDYTIKVDATGLQPGTRYWYRFRHGSETSAIGRTRTLPTGNVGQVRIGVFSCAAFPVGQFHAYANAADRGDIDVALHLGDYIYETGISAAEQAVATLLDRKLNPSYETVTLADYRARYAHYHTDADLRAFHALIPIIPVWDDHELVNGIWKDGAEGHDAGEGSFTARRDAAARAWREWLPVRVLDPANPLKIYRSFNFGNLATLHMLDARVIGRDAPIGRDGYLAGTASDANRQILGQAQQDWLAAGLQASQATWQVLGQQVPMGRMEVPLSVFDAFTQSRLDDYISALDTAPASRSAAQQALVDQPKIPMDLNHWGGYPAGRDKVLAAAKSANRNLVVLAGDSHNAFASNLRDASGQAVGVEYATASVTSTGLELKYRDISRQFLADALVKIMPDLKFAETSHRGYLLLTLTPQAARGDWIFVSSVLDNNFTASVGRSLQTLPGAANRSIVAV